MSGLALSYANTGHQAAADKGHYLVDQLTRCQARARRAGFHDGYLSAFPESFFDRLEAGLPVWSPYYMIHKIMAGLIDQHELTGNAQALETAARLGDWVGWRTGRLSYPHMQRILAVEHGGIAESLTNLYRLTWDESYLRTAERFYDAQVFDPLARGQDDLPGRHANTNIPKMIACIRIWEETGDPRYHDIGRNFWRIVTQHHSYVIGGTSNWEHWHAPDVIAGQLSNRTCENCCSYNMLKLTRLLHFHQPHRIDLIDYYERTLFNQMLGEQDPRSAARLQHLLHRAVTSRFQAAAAIHGQRPGCLLDELSQLLLRRWHRHGDPGQIRRHHLLAGPARAIRQPVHSVRGDLGR